MRSPWKKLGAWGLGTKNAAVFGTRQPSCRHMVWTPQVPTAIIGYDHATTLFTAMSGGASAAVLPAGLQGVDFAAHKPQAIQKVRYSHDAMIDMIVANPWVSQGELAKAFGYTEGWVSQVIASDAFQARLADRKNELVDPTLRATIEEKFKSLVARSFDILMKKMDEGTKVSDETALKAMEIASKALGYGAKGSQVNVQANFVVAVPQKAVSTAAWAEQVGAGGNARSIPPAFQGPKELSETVLVDSSSAAPTIDSKALLKELKGAE